MQLAALLKQLGYDRSRNFLRGRELDRAGEFAHIFRRAAKDPCFLQGVYTLRAPTRAPVAVPLVYVCKARSKDIADRIHQLVWNQNVVPFLIVHTPTDVRVYSGFQYRRKNSVQTDGLLLLKKFNDITDIVDDFHAESLDDGGLGAKRGADLRPQHRVDWELLGNLQNLDHWLQNDAGLKRNISHALIGKYVYLHYLRDREILSDAKLARWGIRKESVFGRDATLSGLTAVVARLEAWLNGHVFPLTLRGPDAPKSEHLTRVAATFAGDELYGQRDWQLWLDFKRYNFSYIPIETLSVIYEQFLHAPETDGKTTRGRDIGAYYTPIPVVNLMLAEIEDRHPLKKGMRVLDPACGSGAFLVQSYRRLIEKEFPPHGSKNPDPISLRQLLQEHIFGVDCDSDACSVTELSLTLTLLDYVEPPDLENDRRVTLPNLCDQNIFCANFFRDGQWRTKLGRQKFDWIVGNPPWKRLNPKDLDETDQPVWQWMTDRRNRSEHPVGGNQVARAFSWEVTHYLSSGGEVALLLPAMTMFEDAAGAFRKRFFSGMQVHAVANLSNLRHVLFNGRAVAPAAAFFYKLRLEDTPPSDATEVIVTYSPLLLNQELTRRAVEKGSKALWSLVVNGSEVGQVRRIDVADGLGLPWKLAIWGSHLDRQLIAKLQKRFFSRRDLQDDAIFVVAQGPELRDTSVQKGSGQTEPRPELIGQNVLKTDKLRGQQHLFSVPAYALAVNKKGHLRLRGGRQGLKVCAPPHVLVSAARKFAVYSDEYIIIPPRQIGIASPSGDKPLLKALSLFLSSDFAFYHQFLTSTEFGVGRDRATLDALKGIPIPLSDLTRRELQDWTRLHAALVKAAPHSIGASCDGQMRLDQANSANEDLEALLAQLNDLTYDSLGLERRERALVHDLVHVRLALNDGQLGELAAGPPGPDQIRAYAKRLKRELDNFMGNEVTKKHRIDVVHSELSGLIQVELTKDIDAARKVIIQRADADAAAELEQTHSRLRRKWAQWVYFDRNLRIYEGRRTFILKPMQRYHWTESQAMADAGEVIADTIARPGDKN